jgi:cell division protein FtsI (penicillin-binding protein 3)
VKAPRISAKRLALVFIFVTLTWCLLLARFAQIQIVEGARFQELVSRQCHGEFELAAMRGAVYDRHGNALVFDTPSESFFTDTYDKKQLRKIGNRISRITGEADLAGRLLRRAGQFNWLARRTDPDMARRIRALDLDSVRCYEEFRRDYPYGDLGVDLLGEVDIDNIGISGIERLFNDLLKPEPGRAAFQRDGFGRVYSTSGIPLVKPKNGCAIELTIDCEYQQIVEEELKRAVDKWNAKSGMAVFIETSTGRLLAADYYSPTGDGAKQKRVFKSRIVSDLFEPGSTFKIVAFAGMIESKQFSLSDTIWAGMGKFKFNRRTLHDDKEHGTITFRRAFELSSNIATARFCQSLGGKRLFKYARQFGFGQRTGIQLPGEQAGSLKKPRNWSEFWTAQTAIGHGVSASALQLASAFGAIANDGKLMKPFLIEEIRSESGRLKQRFTPQPVRQVVSTKTARVLQDLMAGVVDSGTAQVARIDEVLFSGKTGTAQKPDLENGGYHFDKYIAGFGGFFPRKVPMIAGVVLLDEPQKINYGGYTAAPAFAEIARRVVLLDRTRRDIDSRKIAVETHVGLEINHASESDGKKLDIDSQSLFSDLLGPVMTGCGQLDKSLKIRIRDCRRDVEEGIFPDLKGISARDAAALLYDSGCKLFVYGNGNIVDQEPTPGSLMQGIESVRLTCSSGKERSH